MKTYVVITRLCEWFMPCGWWNPSSNWGEKSLSELNEEEWEGGHAGPSSTEVIFHEAAFQKAIEPHNMSWFKHCLMGWVFIKVIVWHMLIAGLLHSTCCP